MRDHDSERKEKGKVYADCQRNACEGEIQEGDKVLLRPEKERNCQVAIQTARQMEFSLPLSTVLVYLNYMSLRIECNNDCCNTCMCIHMITVSSDGP